MVNVEVIVNVLASVNSVSYTDKCPLFVGYQKLSFESVQNVQRLCIGQAQNHMTNVLVLCKMVSSFYIKEMYTKCEVSFLAVQFSTQVVKVDNRCMP